MSGVNDAAVHCSDEVILPVKSLNKHTISVQGYLAPLLESPVTPVITMLVDTGAEKSVLSKKLYDEQLSSDVRLNPAKFQLSSVNGQRLMVYGQCDVEVLYKTHRLVHSFMVADVNDSVILGADFLKQYRASWNWDTLELDLADVESTNPILDEKRAHRIRIKSDISIVQALT